MDGCNVARKATLIGEIGNAWSDLQSFLEPLTERQATLIRDDHGWSVKDHLTHLAAWEQSVIAFLRGRPRHEGLRIGRALYQSGDFDQMNAAIQARHRDESFSQAMTTLQGTHRQLMSLIDGLSDEDLGKPLHHFLAGARADDPRPATKIISDNTSAHFREHLAWMKALITLPK